MFLEFWGGSHLWPFRVNVEFFHQVHPTFGVHRPINNTISQAHSLQMNCNDVEHAGPLGHDHTTHYKTEHAIWITHVILTFAGPLASAVLTCG